MTSVVSPTHASTGRWTSATSDTRIGLIAAAAYVWLRVMVTLTATAFETPDTQSYRSGQATRPPVSAALLSWLDDTTYVLVSSVVSSVGFAALAWALWNPRRRRCSQALVVMVALVSMMPLVAVYEHWLVPDSLLIGFSLLALALATRPIAARWYPWCLVALSILMTCTKEVGFGLVLLVSVVAALRGSARAAGAAGLISAVLFALVVLPSSGREGRVLWFQPLETELTMERFRVVVVGVNWPDLSPQLAEVAERSAACGMTKEQLVAETFQVADTVVGFDHCPGLWEVVDDVSHADILLAHARNPDHLAASIERGFAPDMSAMASWSASSLDVAPIIALDRYVAGALALLPFAVLTVALARRRARLLALTGTLASSLALAAALIDPSSQDRHTIAFRIVAVGIGLTALSEATAPDVRVDVDSDADGGGDGDGDGVVDTDVLADDVDATPSNRSAPVG